VDGRSARWDRHRRTRWVELVDATIRAIRTHGAGVGMDEIAAEAGTSKTVIYRHFEDKAGLYRAVAERIDDRVVTAVTSALAEPTRPGPRGRIASLLDAYLTLVDSDAELYRFFVLRPLLDRPLADDPVGGTVTHVAARLEEAFGTALAAGASDADEARRWSLALVGAVHAVADDWLSRPDREAREDVVESLTALAWEGLAPVLHAPRRRVPG
jgi:AcrR family transcriptional regulator